MRQPIFSDVECFMRKPKAKREKLLKLMDEIISWEEWVGAVESCYPSGRRDRPPMGIGKMSRMHPL